jgi:hypothetical protein
MLVSRNRQEIWKALHRATVSVGLAEKLKIVYYECENRLVTPDKNPKISKCLVQLKTKVFYLLGCSAW